jgi:hypothetical protein
MLGGADRNRDALTCDLIPDFRTEPITIFVFRKVRSDFEAPANESAESRIVDCDWETGNAKFTKRSAILRHRPDPQITGEAPSGCIPIFS